MKQVRTLLATLLMMLCLVLPYPVNSTQVPQAMRSAGPTITLADHIKRHCYKACVKPSELRQAVHHAASSLQVDHKILLAIIQVESAFKPRAKNGSNVGLNQVNLRYHRKRFEGKNFYDVQQNVLAGAQVYRACLTRAKGNQTKALRCYNGHHLGDPKYVIKIRKAYSQINQLADVGPILSASPSLGS